MLNEEKEIKNKSEDSLNRSNFAESLASNIQNYFNRKSVNNCLTIGLMGEWGSGKTSTLNLTKNCLNKTDIKIIEFNPWIYSSYNQLVEQFFNSLIREFSNDDDALKKYFNEYKLKLNKMDLVKNIAISGASYINSSVGSFTERFLKLDSEENNLEKIKAKINNKLKNHKVLFIIDDLDRLPKDEIAEMFKLIKIMADFKNIIYLISFDKNVVSESLKEKYGGERYIEKIINVPLQIPSIDYIELRDCLEGHFKRISDEYEKDLDLNRLHQFLDFKPYDYNKLCGILYFFRNMRDVTRFINILEFNIELIKDEVNLVDFIVLTAIQVFHSNIYEELKFNEFLLIDYHYQISDKINKNNINQEQNEFENLVNNNTNLNHILRILFPKMEGIYKKHTPIEFKNKDYADKNLLICHPNHFKAYFKLNSVIKDLSESETDFIVNHINSGDNSTVIVEFTRLYKENKLRLFFENIKNRLYKINKFTFFLDILFNVETLMWEDIFFYNRDSIEELCMELIYNLNNKYRFKIFKEKFQKSNNMILLYDLVDTIKQKNYNPLNHNEIILTDNQIKEFSEMLKEKFDKISNNSYIVQNRLKEVLYIGDKLNLENKNNEIIDYLISTSSGILTLLNSFLFINENSSLLLKNIETLNNYKNIDEIKQAIDKNGTINEEPIVKNFFEGYKMFKNLKNE